MTKHNVNEVAGAGIAAATMKMDRRTAGLRVYRYILIIDGIGTLCADVIGTNRVLGEDCGAVSIKKGGRG